MTDATTVQRMRIGLASARNSASFDERLAIVERFIAEGAERDVAAVCFPEAYLPGLRGMDFSVPAPDQARQESALAEVQALARRHRIAVILPMEWATPLGLHNLAFVIDRDGAVLGHQTKNQLPVTEAPYYIGDGQRRLFSIDGVSVGITICHEGWRYPESVRWSATRGARLIFHPHLTGSDAEGPMLSRWGDPHAPYYEKAMIARAVENNVWFASVNCALRYQESATTLIDPEGRLAAYVPYGDETLLVQEIDLSAATLLHARRHNPALYPGEPDADQGLSASAFPHIR